MAKITACNEARRVIDCLFASGASGSQDAVPEDNNALDDEETNIAADDGGSMCTDLIYTAHSVHPGEL